MAKLRGALSEARKYSKEYSNLTTPAKNNAHSEAMGIIFRWGRYVSRNKDSTG